MASNPHLLALSAFVNEHPTIKLVKPSSPEFSSLRKVWNSSHSGLPLAIVQPQSALDVAVLIQFVKANSLPFTIRTGGHNLEGRSAVDNALQIDLRALNTVTISPDRKSATVGGGILQQELGNRLSEEGLAVATGSVPSVGYTGWATYGGYGPSSSHWGFGGWTKSSGIRGAGGVFGVIVDLTIKLYPLPGLLAGPIIFDSTDIAKAFVDFNTAYTHLLDTEGLPAQLTLQRVCFNSPRGRVLAASFVWSGSHSEIEEGQRWASKIASLAPCKMNAAAPTTIPEWFARNGGRVPSSVYGSSWTHNLVRIPEHVAEVIGQNIARLPSDSGMMFSLHQLRGPSVEPDASRLPSVFASREPHYMLEILRYGAIESAREAAEKWAAQMATDIEEAGPGNVLRTAYVSVYNAARAESPGKALKKTYGEHAGLVRELKARWDPGKLFKLAVQAMERKECQDALTVGAIVVL
ncbi:FAD-binding domain-containing protein [Aspergillus aurantiobrunneus]